MRLAVATHGFFTRNARGMAAARSPIPRRIPHDVPAPIPTGSASPWPVRRRIADPRRVSVPDCQVPGRGRWWIPDPWLLLALDAWILGQIWCRIPDPWSSLMPDHEYLDNNGARSPVSFGAGSPTPGQCRCQITSIWPNPIPDARSQIPGEVWGWIPELWSDWGLDPSAPASFCPRSQVSFGPRSWIFSQFQCWILELCSVLVPDPRSLLSFGARSQTFSKFWCQILDLQSVSVPDPRTLVGFGAGS